MRVLKFGGTSMGSAASMQEIATILKPYGSSNKLVVVVSAMSGTTDLLIGAGQKASTGDLSYKDSLAQIESKHLNAAEGLFDAVNRASVLSRIKKWIHELDLLLEAIEQLREFTPKMQDKLMSYGEVMSSYLFSEKLKADGYPVSLVDSRQCITTNNEFGKAQVDFAETNMLINQHLSDVTWAVMPGFIASTRSHETTTLGRGGSDYTAAIVAAAVGAEALEIWTDVNGMMTADPRMVQQALTLSEISYEEAMELSHFGAKVIYPPTIQPVMDKNIPVWIKNTFEHAHYGTRISRLAGHQYPVTGITAIRHISLLTIKGSGMVGVPGISMRLFGALFRKRINVVLISQSSSEHSISVAVNDVDTSYAQQAIDEEFSTEIKAHQIEPAQVEEGLSIVAAVGDNMRSHHGLSGKMFTALGRNAVNIRAIAQGSNEKNISAVIKHQDVRKALNALHETFFTGELKTINLFIAGVGNVGQSLLKQLQAQEQYLRTELGISLRLMGIANSRKMLLSESGIHLDRWQKEFENASDYTAGEFIGYIRSLNVYNSVFVDNTASDVIARLYPQLLEHGVSVVTCNKIACASEYAYYQHLKSLAKKYNANFLFETNVGAGLPVINTLNDLLRSGDKILKIEAVLSGTLNFVFNHFKQGVSFRSVVEEAQKQGYTEPDPRIDLSGIDVMRKILILARESGVRLELEDVKNNSFLPKECLEAESVDAFYNTLDTHSLHFNKLLEEATAQGKRLKYVAVYENGVASVGLQMVDERHPFYDLQGKDNIVQFTTLRYPEQPLTVRGAGAGAEVTASGVFADIIKTVSN